MKKAVCTIISVLAVLLAISCGGGDDTVFDGIVIHVAPRGDDDGDGSVRRPFATVTRARDAIRQLKADGGFTRPVMVRIHEGVYPMDEPLVLTPADSGDPHPVVYAAAPGEQAVLSGGRTVTGWREGAGGVWTVTLPDVASGDWYFRQLFVNGERRRRARIPNDGFLRVDGMVSREERSRFSFAPGDIDPAWAGRGDVQAVVLQKWAETRMFIREVDSDSSIVTLSGVTPPSNRENNARYWIENAPEGLDAPGEWYLDRESGVLAYIPMPGEDMTAAEVVAPRLDELVRFAGNPVDSSYVTGIELRNLALRYSDWTIGAEGYGDVQAAYDIPAVVMATGARGVTIRDCSILHHGKYGISLDMGCSGNSVIGNELGDLGAGGVKVGEPRDRDEERLQTWGNLVSDNTIHDIGEVYPAACGVIIFRSNRNTIAHNEIYNTYYTGISNGWSWGYAETNTYENIIEYNHVHDIGRGMLSDMGGNYNLGVQPGTVIRNNVFHDISSHGYGGWGIYTDEGSTHILIENNVVYRTKTGGFHQHYGRENTVRNNIFAFSTEDQIQRTRKEPHLSFTFERNIVIFDSGKLLGWGPQSWDDENFRMDYNCYWRTDGEPIDFAGFTFEAWKARGQDVNSIVADPMFADPRNGDFTIEAGSPVLDLGFEPIDTSTVGPRESVLSGGDL